MKGALHQPRLTVQPCSARAREGDTYRERVRESERERERVRESERELERVRERESERECESTHTGVLSALLLSSCSKRCWSEGGELQSVSGFRL